MIRIIALSDIYGEIEIINELIERFDKKFDVCIIAGGINKPNENKSKEIFEKLTEISEKILFVNGGTDKIEIEDSQKISNLENNPIVLNKNELKIGFLGIGGVPDRSIKRKSEYQNIWNEALWHNKLLRKMNVDYNKIKIEKPDFFFFISHTPPYGIADYSRKITLNELESTQDIEEQDIEEKRKSTNPLHLGSKIIREFILRNKIHIHIFGHVHKEGGKLIRSKDTTFINVAHLSTLPYKLTGRKFCIVHVDKENVQVEFKNVVNPELDLENFLEVYL